MDGVSYWQVRNEDAQKLRGYQDRAIKNIAKETTTVIDFYDDHCIGNHSVFSITGTVVNVFRAVGLCNNKLEV